MSGHDRPYVGIAVIVIKDNKEVLMHKRLGNHAPDVWAFFGGHLELNESWEDCALRELAEEVGTDLQVTDPICFTVKNVIFPEEHRHYVTVFMWCDWKRGEPYIAEPDKCSEIKWFPLDELPSPLMTGCQMLVDGGQWDILKSLYSSFAKQAGSDS